jgi:hypothetical protein
VEKGVFCESCFAKQQGRSPPPRSFARTSLSLAVCAQFTIAPVPAAVLGGFGLGGGRGASGFLNHGLRGGFGLGRGMRLRGSMHQGVPAFGGKALRGGPPFPLDQPMGTIRKRYSLGFALISCIITLIFMVYLLMITVITIIYELPISSNSRYS